MVLIYPSSCAMIIEADEDTMLKFIKEIDQLTESVDGYFDSGRIVTTCENCPERIFKKQIVQQVTRARVFFIFSYFIFIYLFLN